MIHEHVNGRDGALLVIDVLAGGVSGDELFEPDVEQILQRSRQPMLVLGPGAGELDLPVRTLVVPGDGAGLLAATVPVVRSWIATLGTADVVLVALDAVDPWPAGGDPPPEDDADRAARTLADEGVPARIVRPPTSDPAATIRAVCHGAATPMIVVGSPRWSTGVTHWPSTVRRLIRTAACPVLVVPAGITDPQPW
jgi:nucleotide-binding universal stress UspA family protein